MMIGASLWSASAGTLYSPRLFMLFFIYVCAALLPLRAMSSPFDVTDFHWDVVPSSLPSPRAFHNVAAVGGLVFVIGGCEVGEGAGSVALPHNCSLATTVDVWNTTGGFWKTLKLNTTIVETGLVSFGSVFAFAATLVEDPSRPAVLIAASGSSYFSYTNDGRIANGHSWVFMLSLPEGPLQDGVELQLIQCSQTMLPSYSGSWFSYGGYIFNVGGIAFVNGTNIYAHSFWQLVSQCIGHSPAMLLGEFVDVEFLVNTSIAAPPYTGAGADRFVVFAYGEVHAVISESSSASCRSRFTVGTRIVFRSVRLLFDLTARRMSVYQCDDAVILEVICPLDSAKADAVATLAVDSLGWKNGYYTVDGLDLVGGASCALSARTRSVGSVASSPLSVWQGAIIALTLDMVLIPLNSSQYLLCGLKGGCEPFVVSNGQMLRGAALVSVAGRVWQLGGIREGPSDVSSVAVFDVLPTASLYDLPRLQYYTPSAHMVRWGCDLSSPCASMMGQVLPFSEGGCTNSSAIPYTTPIGGVSYINVSLLGGETISFCSQRGVCLPPPAFNSTYCARKTGPAPCITYDRCPFTDVHGVTFCCVRPKTAEFAKILLTSQPVHIVRVAPAFVPTTPPTLERNWYVDNAPYIISVLYGASGLLLVFVGLAAMQYNVLLKKASATCDKAETSTSVSMASSLAFTEGGGGVLGFRSRRSGGANVRAGDLGSPSPSATAYTTDAIPVVGDDGSDGWRGHAAATAGTAIVIVPVEAPPPIPAVVLAREQHAAGSKRLHSSRSSLKRQPVYLADYRVVDVIGEGAYGVVLKGIRRHDKQTVAIKFMVCQSDADRQKAMQEYRLVKRFQGHPHIVQISDLFINWEEEDHGGVYPYVGASGSHSMVSTSASMASASGSGSTGADELKIVLSSPRFVCIVLEYFPAGDLKRYLQLYPDPVVPEGVAIKILLQIADALAQLHSSRLAPVAHRDLKPDNVLVDARRDRVLLTDFGLATEVPEGALLPSVGTPLYLAPETVAGRGGVAADLWALGCIAYAIATRRVGQNNARVLFRELREKGVADAMCVEMRHYSDAYKSLTMSLLSLEPSERPTAAEVQARCCAMRDGSTQMGIVPSKQIESLINLGLLPAAGSDKRTSGAKRSVRRQEKPKQ